MDIDSKRELLEIARKAVVSSTSDGTGDDLSLKNAYPKGCGAFVTLHGPDHSLRGCIGCLSSDQSLPELISDMARSSAQRDPRFSPVQASEVENLEIEISVLSPAELVKTLDEVIIGRDGLLVVGRGSRGVLLPQVASERGWDVATFVEQTCVKANLDRNAYADDQVELYKFSAEVFNERSL